MQRDAIVKLWAKPQHLNDVRQFIIRAAADRDVLNVGAAGGVEGYLPANRDEWLHDRLMRVARVLVGVDVDGDSIRYAASHGFEIVKANCETMDLGRHFDLIVFSDVIEHLNAPGDALSTLVRHLRPGGRLLVTTPNPTHYGLWLRAIASRQLSIYYDHVNSFVPENIQAMCDRYGCRLTELYFFGFIDRRSFIHRLKSHVTRMIGWLSPRLEGSFLAVIEPGDNV